jgi:hypothetical protein
MRTAKFIFSSLVLIFLGVPLNVFGQTVDIESQHLSCKDDSDCVMISAGCGTCCPGLVVINKVHKNFYDRRRASTCSKGPDNYARCGCIYKDNMIPKCEGQKCVTIEFARKDCEVVGKYPKGRVDILKCANGHFFVEETSP